MERAGSKIFENGDQERVVDREKGLKGFLFLFLATRKNLIEFTDGEITYSLYVSYLEEIEDLQSLNREAAAAQEKLKEELLMATVQLETLQHSLKDRETSSDSVLKQNSEDTDAIEYLHFILLVFRII